MASAYTLEQTTAVILAAGKGTRMESSLPKVLHEVGNKAMVLHVISALKSANVSRIITVVGYKSELVIPVLPLDVLYVFQREQLGTGHALKCASPLSYRQGSVLVVCGDTPLLKPETLESLVLEREVTGAAAVMLTMVLDDPARYGRVVRDGEGNVKRVVEFKDASDEIKQVKEVNSGVYCFDAALVFDALTQVKASNAQKEYYLPDVLSIFLAQGKTVNGKVHNEPEELLGVNRPEELLLAEEVLRQRNS